MSLEEESDFITRAIFYAILLTLALLFISIDAAGDFNHSPAYVSPPVVNSLTGVSCLNREITQLRTAANATLQSAQDLAFGAAKAFDRLAELGQNC